tara:strand:- start:2011 stop:2217 length:207 start_codon:yes stop_codon:yes gene_type:complete
MIRTKFATPNITDWISMLLEFEDKLEKWSSNNANATYAIEVFVGEKEYYVLVTVDSDEEDNNTDSLKL